VIEIKHQNAIIIPIREALTMLMATGLVRKIAGHCCVPTIKGRLLLDLTRVLMFEAQLGVWSDETLLILRHLGVEDVPECRMPEANNDVVGNLIALNLLYAQACGSQFGRELSHVDKDGQTQFYSQFDWRRFVQTASVGSINTARLLADEDSLLFIDEETDPAR